MVIQIPKNSKLSSRTKFLKLTLAHHNMPLAQKALDLMIEEMCAEKGFIRSGSKTHYYHHLVDVTQKLLNIGVRDEKTILVAILHDAIEDTWITYEYIEREFGKEVADDVLTLTKDPNIDYKTDRTALEAYLIRCFSKLRTALVKTADRLHNFGTLGGTPSEKQLRVALETGDNFIPLFKWAREEYPEYSAFFFQAKTEIEPHLEKIKEMAKMQEELTEQLNEKDSEIAKLKEQLALSKLDQMDKVVDNASNRQDYKDHLKEHLTTIDILHKRNKKLEKGLNYYALVANYEGDQPILEDKGLVARTALELDFD